MLWVIAISVCIVGFLAGVRPCCCTICNYLCEPDTNPTGSISVTLPALTDNGLDCGSDCPNFAGTYILDREEFADVVAFLSPLNCGLPFGSGPEACYWLLEISPQVCSGSSLSPGENLVLILRGDDGGVTGFGIELRLCFEIPSFGGTVFWRDSFSDSIPLDCLTDLGTRTLPAENTPPDGFALCTTSSDASVTF